MFGKKSLNAAKKSEEVKRSAGKVVDPKRDTAQRAKHLRIFLDHADVPEVVVFFETYYSHIFYIVYDAFIAAEINLRQKGAHKAQREELESVLYLFEKILIYLPEHLGRKWQYHSVGRLMSKLLHPGNSWKLLKREAMRLFLLWYQVLGEVAGEPLHALFATLVPGFPSPYQGLGLTALAAMTPDTQDGGPINPAEICPLIPPQSGERWRSPDTDLTRIFLDVLLELMVSQVTLVEWKENKLERQKRCLNFLFEKFKTYYMMHIFPDFNWAMSLYRPSLELPEVRKFRPAFVDAGDGTKKLDPMLTCRVVVIKWVAQYTHLTRNNAGANNNTLMAMNHMSVSVSTGLNASVNGHDDVHDQVDSSGSNPLHNASLVYSAMEEEARTAVEGQLVREILYGCRENVDFVHEVYRQAFLLSFSHSPAIKKVITVYKDWIQLNVPELPPFLLEPLNVDKEREDFRNVMQGRISTDALDNPKAMAAQKEQMAIRAGLQNMLQVFVTNAANVFLLEVSGAEYPILLEEQVEMCKRVLNIYRYMVMNVKMEARTWEQLLFILLQITQLTLPETPPRKRADTLGGRLAQAIFQTLIVTWIKANLYVVVSTELWDQFLEVLSSLTLWEELIKEWAKTMETLTRVLARQVYNLDLNDLPLDRLSERATKKRRGRQAPQEVKYSNSTLPQQNPSQESSSMVVAAHHDPTGGRRTGVTSEDEYLSGGSSMADVAPDRHQHQREGNGAPPRKPRRRRQRRRVVRSHSDSSIPAKLSEWRREVLRVEQEFKLRGDAVREREDEARKRKRHKSADSVWNSSGALSSGLIGVARFSESDGKSSRSSSPAPSSGVECNSIKDAPLQLDHDTMSDSGMNDPHHPHGHHPHAVGGGLGAYNHHLSEVTTGEQARSVMSGGGVKGWLPDVAVVLWRRMLGALGDVNAVADTVIHAMVYKYLVELFDILSRIRANQGVSLDNASTPPTPELVPPFTIFAPWCFRALALPDAYQRGKIYALRLLCLLTCRTHDAPLSKTHLVQFYKVLHQGLTGPRSDVTNTLIRFTGPRFFSLGLPGYTAYILDFLYACNAVISSGELRGGVPRTEATSAVGALLAFPGILRPDVPLLLPGSGGGGADGEGLSLVSSADVKDQIIGVLLKSGKKEPAGLARCISLSSLGVFVYAELAHGTFHPKIKEAVQVLLTALRFNNKAVAQIASDMLLLLSDHVDKFLHFYPEVPRKIVEVLARTLLTLASSSSAMSSSRNDDDEDHASAVDDEKRLLLSLLLCLGEWTMKMPRYILTQPQEDGRSLLFHVFAALQGASEPGSLTPSPIGPADAQVRRDGKHFETFPASAKQIAADVTRTFMSPAVTVSDFDPNIHVDNTNDAGNASSSSGSSANPSPIKQARTPTAGEPPVISEPMHPTQQHAPSKMGMQLQVASSMLQRKEDEQLSKSPTRLAARTLLSHMINHLFHFPLPGAAGAASLTSMVSEHDDLDLSAEPSEEMSAEIFSSPNVQFFVVNNSTLLSFVELPSLDVPGHLSGLSSARSQVRVVLRDVSGKFSWDCSALHGAFSDDGGVRDGVSDSDELREKFFPEDSLRKMVAASGNLTATSTPSPTEAKSPGKKGAAAASSGNKVVISLGGNFSNIPTRQRGKGVLPQHEDVGSEQYDNLDDLLRYLTHTSPECLDAAGRPLNSVSAASNAAGEGDVVAAVLGQRNHEQDQSQRQVCLPGSRAYSELPPQAIPAPDDGTTSLDSLGSDADVAVTSAFQHCRRFFNQLGLSSWERRPSVHLVKKNDQLLREIKHLDGKRCREVHKIAVIYVAEGQEDKQSILSNPSGSQAYEEFVSGLAWEVELETHPGFMGGLKRTKTTGETSPYFASSFVEVMFHVATRMPSNTEEAMLGKTRHIGNDEIHIVWSEHSRDYRRGILPTEFCDVLIVIYPLPNGLFRVQVSRKPEVPFFGPLFNETIVDGRVLPGLVRATAVNASRAKRSMLTYYQHHFEERWSSLRSIAANHRDATTFEDFVASVYSPAPLQNLYSSAASAASGANSRPNSLLAPSSIGSHVSASALEGQHHSPLSHQHPHSTSANELLRPRSNKAELSHTVSSPTSPAPIETLDVRRLNLDAAKRPVAIREEEQPARDRGGGSSHHNASQIPNTTRRR